MYIMSNKYIYDSNTLAERLKSIRKERGKTQLELATEIGVNRQSILNWERGNTHSIPSLKNFLDLCSALECNMYYLLGYIDTPEYEPVSLSSHYSKISSEIINYSRNNPTYRDCLNFMMYPDNIKNIFDSLTIDTMKQSWINSSLKGINGEFKEELITYYYEYIYNTPINEVNKASYTAFLKRKYPKEKITLSATRSKNKLYLKRYISKEIYEKFYVDGNFQYYNFIRYIADNTFDFLHYQSALDIQLNNLAQKVVALFKKYLNEED